MLGLVNLLLGGFLLVAGRKLFWLFVGVLGFITGLQLAERLWTGSEGTAILIAIIIGVVFALVAIFLQKLAVGAAGFLAGGFVLTSFTNTLGMDSSGILFLGIYIVGGIIGIALVMLLFDWALIALSSLAGAALIVQSVLPEETAGGIIFFILLIVGMIIQGSLLYRETHRKTKS